jgi:hypothetical protein
MQFHEGAPVAGSRPGEQVLHLRRARAVECTETTVFLVCEVNTCVTDPRRDAGRLAPWPMDASVDEPLSDRLTGDRPPKPHPEDVGDSAERHAAPGGFSQIVRDEHAARRVSGRPTDADGRLLDYHRCGQRRDDIAAIVKVHTRRRSRDRVR